jgi:hypothetical protein
MTSRSLPLLIMIGFTACSPSSTPVVDNPLLKKMDVLAAIYNEEDAQNANYFNRGNIKYSSPVPTLLLKMAGICEQSIIHHDTTLIKALDPTECDKQAHSVAYALTADMKINVTPDMVKDPAFWVAWRAFIKRRMQKMIEDNAAKLAGTKGAK